MHQTPLDLDKEITAFVPKDSTSQQPSPPASSGSRSPVGSPPLEIDPHPEHPDAPPICSRCTAALEADSQLADIRLRDEGVLSEVFNLDGPGILFKVSSYDFQTHR